MKVLISLLAILLFSFGCNSNPVDSEEEMNFDIYLTKNIDNNSPMNVTLDKLILEDEPILSNQLIDSYVWDNHSITYSNEAKEKIKLKEPLFGRYFVVKAQNQRIYWGLFTDFLSSGGCQNPVIILLPRHPNKSSFITNVFVIDRAYPGYSGNENDKDLRADLRIYNALQKSGELN